MVVLEECCLVGIEWANVQGHLNAPLQQGLLDAGLGTQQVVGVSEGNPTPVEQLVDVRGRLNVGGICTFGYISSPTTHGS